MTLDELYSRCEYDPATGCKIWQGSFVGRHGKYYPALRTTNTNISCRKILWDLLFPGLDHPIRLYVHCKNSLCLAQEHLFFRTSSGTKSYTLASFKKMRDAQVARRERLWANRTMCLANKHPISRVVVKEYRGDRVRRICQDCVTEYGAYHRGIVIRDSNWVTMAKSFFDTL